VPRVTVVTGYYNRRDVVDRTLQSVLNQTYKDFEFVAFDDCSPDGTLEALRAFAAVASDPRLRVQPHETNIGFVSGLKRVIDQTDSEYIAIQGSGDYSFPRRLEQQLRLLDSRPDVGAVGSWYENYIEDNGIRRLRQPNADDATFESLLRGSNVFSHGEVMIRRSTYEATGGYRTEFTNSQDIDLWLRIAQVSRLATVPELLYTRHVQFDGVSYSPKKFPTQMKYSLAARELATMESPTSAYWLSRIGDEGPGCLIGDSHPVLQRLYFRAAVRSAVWGATQDAISIAGNLRSRVTRQMVTTAIRGYASRPASPVRSLIQKRLGVSA
jgi:glycosyltransferase involved in cell wall biosynthesis